MIATLNNVIAKKRDENEKGFTLIELLVVILIIGVLAAIAIPAFLNQRQGAWESQVKSDIANAAIAAESYSVAHNGAYASSADTASPTIVGDGTQLKSYGFNKTDGVKLTIALVGTTGYTIVGKHDSLGTKTWTYSSIDGKTVVTAGS